MAAGKRGGEGRRGAAGAASLSATPTPTRAQAPLPRAAPHLDVVAGHLALKALLEREQRRVDGVLDAHLPVVAQRGRSARATQRRCAGRGAHNGDTAQGRGAPGHPHIQLRAAAGGRTRTRARAHLLAVALLQERLCVVHVLANRARLPRKVGAGGVDLVQLWPVVVVAGKQQRHAKGPHAAGLCMGLRGGRRGVCG